MRSGILEPSVAQPPLPLQLFLPEQPLSPLLQPPWPLQSFWPLQECFVVDWCIVDVPNDALPTFVTGLVALVVAACIVAAPLIKPDTAAATNRDFIECFILVIPPFNQALTRRKSRRWEPGCAALTAQR